MARNQALQGSSDLYYRDLLSANKLKRPEGLAKVEVRLMSMDYEPEGPDFTSQFQELLDRECSKGSFFHNCGDRSGCLALEPGDFIAGKAQVWLFSTKQHSPKEDWVEVRCNVARPFDGGNFF